MSFLDIVVIERALKVRTSNGMILYYTTVRMLAVQQYIGVSIQLLYGSVENRLNFVWWCLPF